MRGIGLDIKRKGVFFFLICSWQASRVPNGYRLLPERFARVTSRDAILAREGEGQGWERRGWLGCSSWGGLEYLGRGGSTAYRGSSLPPDGVIRELPKTREVRRCLEGRYGAVFRRERCSNYVWKRFR